MRGEYEGKDGRRYRISLVDGYVEFHMLDMAGVSIGEGLSVKDWPAARAALDELLAEDEWVEFEHSGVNYRVRRDGSSADATRKGLYLGAQWPVAKAYRKGREVALADVQQLEAEVERLREVAEAVLDEEAWDRLHEEQYHRIVALAEQALKETGRGTG